MDACQGRRASDGVAGAKHRLDYDRAIRRCCTWSASPCIRRMAYPNASLVELALGEEGSRRAGGRCSTLILNTAVVDGIVDALWPGLYGPGTVDRDAVRALHLLHVVCNHWTPICAIAVTRVPTAPVLATWPQDDGYVGLSTSARRRVRLRSAGFQCGDDHDDGQPQAHARLLELRPHPPADRRPGEARRHRSRHPDPAAAADRSSACWTTRNSRSPSCRSPPTRR